MQARSAAPATRSFIGLASACTQEIPRRAAPLIAKAGPSRTASTSASISEGSSWRAWLKKASSLNLLDRAEDPPKALLFAGLGSYPHTPHSPTTSSLQVWETASEAVLEPDATIGYWPARMEEFAGALGGGRGVRGWLRGWVEGRSLDELMSRADVTAAFILTSSIAILASAQEQSGSSSLLPSQTRYLAGHGFIGTLTALVAAGRLDLPTGVRLAMTYASLPPSPPGLSDSPHLRPKFLTTVLSARHFHSLSQPPYAVPRADDIAGESPAETSDSPAQRKRAMQLILDEVHAMQKEWVGAGDGEWAAPAIINSSKVLALSGTQMAVLQAVDRLQYLGLANPVIDLPTPCPFHTRLMEHAVPKFKETLSRCSFNEHDPHDAEMGSSSPYPIILDPLATHPIGPAHTALSLHLTEQLRWFKTLSRLYNSSQPDVSLFYTVGRGAKGLGVMLRGELKRRKEAWGEVEVQEFGVKQDDGPLRLKPH